MSRFRTERRSNGPIPSLLSLPSYLAPFHPSPVPFFPPSSLSPCPFFPPPFHTVSTFPAFPPFPSPPLPPFPFPPLPPSPHPLPPSPLLPFPPLSPFAAPNSAPTTSLPPPRGRPVTGLVGDGRGGGGRFCARGSRSCWAPPSTPPTCSRSPLAPVPPRRGGPRRRRVRSVTKALRGGGGGGGG